MQRKLVLGFCVIILFLSLLSFLPIHVEASPSVEKIFDTDFESGIVGLVPPSATAYVNASTLEVEVSTDQKVSGTQSLMINDTNAGVAGSVEFRFPWLERTGNLTYWTWMNTTTCLAGLEMYNNTYTSNTALLKIWFSSDGKIYYYNGATHLIQVYNAQTWYNITLTLASTTFDIYVNGTLRVNDASWWRQLTWNMIRLDTGTVTTGVQYFDDVSLYSEFASVDFYWEDTFEWQFLNEYYWAYVRKDNDLANEARGLISAFRPRTQWGSFSILFRSGTAVHGILFNEMKIAGVPYGMSTTMTDVTITITDLGGGVIQVVSSGADAYWQNTNTYYFDENSRYVYWQANRHYTANANNVYERQLDFLFRYEYPSKAFWTNSSGFYTATAGQHLWSYSSSADAFPINGYYFNTHGHDLSIGSINFYVYENDSRIAGWSQFGNYTGFVEWELTFGECYSVGYLQNVVAGTTCRAGGLLVSFNGDEETTEDMRTLAQSQFSNPSNYAMYPIDEFYLSSTATLNGNPSFESETETLTFTINSTSGETSKTQVYCGEKGHPESVIGADSAIYDIATRVCTVSLTHSSAYDIIIEWEVTEVAGTLGLAIIALTFGLCALVFALRKGKILGEIGEGGL